MMEMPELQFFRVLPPGWRMALKSFAREPILKGLFEFLQKEQVSGKTISPPVPWMFSALQKVDLPRVKVVILGQDPYHGPGQATGFSFAVPDDFFPKPPSLRNILKEFQTDLGIVPPVGKSDLQGWGEQGVLLLNSVLTVEVSRPLSHQGKGWECFTDEVIRVLGEREKPLVFILWGSHAQKMKKRADLSRHGVIESAHPSPLSAYRGFFGSRPFSRANEFLVRWGQVPVQWEKI